MNVKRLAKGTLAAVILAAVVVSAGAWYWRRNNDPSVSLRTVAVQRTDLMVAISATGTVQPEELVDVGAQVAGRIVFFGKDKSGKEIDYGSEVEEGTVLVKDIRSGGSSNPDQLTAVNNTLFFRANDGASGVELWKSDGTAAGTLFLRDINPGSANSNPTAWVTTQRFAYFRAASPAGTQLWRSDGTPAGTIPNSGMPGDPVVVSAGTPFSLLSGSEWQVYFGGMEPSVGTELFVLVERLHSDGFESGDTGAWSAGQP